MNSVLTLIAADHLDDSMLDRLRQTLADASAHYDAPVWLAPGRVADIGFSGADPTEISRQARHCLAGLPIDMVVQDRDGRRKKLLLADMDSTIVVGETLDELASFAGLKPQIAAITAKTMRGEIDFKAALIERVALLAGLDESALALTEQTIELTPGARTLVATMRDFGAYCVLVSGGFDYFTSKVRQRCLFDEDRANRLEMRDGRLTGKVIEPILDRHAKLAFLKEFVMLRGLDLSQTLAVGDGANDLEMIAAAGLGAAFHAKPVVAESAHFRIDHNDLSALLYAQGYRQEELVVE
jgi:phosphoserine phosphatase